VTYLHQEIASRVAAWRADGYACSEFPVIAEVLEWARASDTGALRYLRRPQLQALETHGYLRLVENTPHIADLYRKIYPPGNNLAGLLEAVGIPDAAFKAANYSIELTDPAKTEFFVEYKDDKGKWRRYSPDFVIRKKPKRGAKRGSGKVLIVEIKAERERAHLIDGEHGRKALALRKWERLNPGRLKYQMIFTSTATVTADQIREVRQFVEETST
jgi:hypothetical protein